MKKIKGPAIFLAQFVGEDEPFNSLENICNWTTLAGVSAAEVITVTDIDVNDGDAVGLIKQGTPDKIDVYFARLDSKNVSSNVTETKFKFPFTTWEDRIYINSNAL